MAVYLIRHGESEGNREKFFQGRIDTELTGLGVQQAQSVGTWLKRREILPDITFCSPLKRAKNTAGAITNILGCPAPQVQPGLIEYCAGKLEGLTIPEIEKKFPDYANQPLGERDDYSKFGGESYNEVQTRLREFIDLVEPMCIDDDVLAVSHGGALNQLIKLWCSLPVPQHFFQHISNCTCYKLVIKEVAGRRTGVLEWMVPEYLMRS